MCQKKPRLTGSVGLFSTDPHPSLTCQASLRLNFGRSDSPDPGLGLLCPLSSSPNFKKINPSYQQADPPSFLGRFARKLAQVGASARRCAPHSHTLTSSHGILLKLGSAKILHVFVHPAMPPRGGTQDSLRFFHISRKP